MFDKNKIEKLENLFTKIKEVKEYMLSEFKRATDDSKETIFDVERNGEMQKIKGETLWYEIQNLGRNCQAGDILEPLFPTVFSSSAEYEELVADMNKFCAVEFNINPLEMSILDIIRISQATVEMMLKGRE